MGGVFYSKVHSLDRVPHRQCIRWEHLVSCLVRFGVTHVVLVYLGWTLAHVPQERGLDDDYVSVQNRVVEPYVSPPAVIGQHQRQSGSVDLQMVLR